MERTKAAKLLRWTAVACAVFLAALRVVILKTAFDENGLLPVGSKALIVTVLASVACFAALWLLSLRLNPLPGTEACFSRRPIFLVCGVVASILVFIGALTSLLAGVEETEKALRIASFSGMAAALAMLWSALAADRGRQLFWLRLIPALYAGAALIIRFRSWSHDPLIIHIVPLLLAWTCCMVEMMLLTGFPLGAGHRRSGALFGLAAVVFTSMAIPDYILGLQAGLHDLLTLVGLALWGGAAALELLRKQVQTEAPAEPEQVES